MAQPVTGQLGAEGCYWDALALGRLELPRCAGCGRWNWPAVWRCGDCGSWEHDWTATRLAGSVFSWTRTWHKFGGAEGLQTPFVTALVTLADAPVRLLGVVEGDETSLRIGAMASGRIGRTPFGEAAIPAICWSLDA